MTAPLLTLNEAAGRLAMSRRWLQQQITLGQVAVVRLGPRAVRVEAAELDRLIAARRVQATPPPSPFEVRRVIEAARRSRTA